MRKSYFKSILENHLQLSFIDKSYTENKMGKVENLTLNHYILEHFTYNMDTFLDSNKGH